MSPNLLYYEILDRTEKQLRSYVSGAEYKAQNILNLDSNVKRMPTETEAIYSEFEDLIEDNSELFLTKNVSAIQFQVDQFTGKLKNVFFQRSGEAHYTEWDLLQSDTQSRVDSIIPPMLSSEVSHINSLPPEEPPFLWLDRKKPDLVKKWNAEHPFGQHITRKMPNDAFIKRVYQDWHGINLLKTDLRKDITLYRQVCKLSDDELLALGLFLPTKTDLYNMSYNGSPLPQSYIDRIDESNYIAVMKKREERKETHQTM